MFRATLHLFYLYFCGFAYELARVTEPEYDCTNLAKEGRNAFSSLCFIILGVYRLFTCEPDHTVFHIMYLSIGVLILFNHSIYTNDLCNEYIPCGVFLYILWNSEKIIFTGASVIYFSFAFAMLVIGFYTKNGSFHVFWHVQFATALDQLISR